MTAKTGNNGLSVMIRQLCKFQYNLQFANALKRFHSAIARFNFVFIIIGVSNCISHCIAHIRSVFSKLATLVVMAMFLGAAAGCSSQISQHGHLLTEADLAQVQVGMSKQQVNFLLGTPDTTATYTGDVYYYISSKMETKSFLTPKEIERRVVAVYFAPQIDTVKRVAHYGLQDGKVIDFISRETPSHGQEASLLTQLFRGLGAKTNLFE